MYIVCPLSVLMPVLANKDVHTLYTLRERSGTNIKVFVADSGAKGDTGEPGAKGDTGLIGKLTCFVAIICYDKTILLHSCCVVAR